MKDISVDLSECIKCELCVEVCPEVFTLNDAGYIEVEELETYPEESLLEAVKNCPEDCILYSDD
jgi:ferredoxin